MTTPRKYILQPGEVFGELTILDEVQSHRYLCCCVCGTEKIIEGARLARGEQKSCGCLMNADKRTLRAGDRFGRLTVIRFIGMANNQGRYLCICDCGKKHTVRTSHLQKGSTQSCGCLRFGRPNPQKGTKRPEFSGSKAPGYRHGETGTPTYRSWRAMINRCTKPSEASYHRYGGRGITVCDQWFDYMNFRSDMGERPEGTSIDRIDNDGNYEPGNCRWATSKVQAQNKRKVS